MAIALAVTLPPPARADAPGDAWAVAKSVLPANPGIVFGVNVAAVKASPLFAGVLRASHVDETLDGFKQACHVDFRDVVLGIVAAFDDDRLGAGAFYLATSLDHDRILGCLKQIAAKDGDTLTESRPDAQGVVELRLARGGTSAYVVFKKNVVVIAAEPDDKAMLLRYLGGNGVQPTARAYDPLSKVVSGADAWGVYTTEQGDLGDGGKISVVYGSADDRGGVVSANVHIKVSSAADAIKVLDMLKRSIGKTKSDRNGSPAIAKALDGITWRTEGSEIVASASVSEADLLAFLRQML
jgi:hypothetical protein